MQPNTRVIEGSAQSAQPEVDLENLFMELGNDIQISVDRKEPEWATGHIKTVNYDGEEQLSLDWIKKKFGGRKLVIRVYGPVEGRNKYLMSRTVFINGPPRNGDGIEVVQGPEGESVEVTKLEETMRRYNERRGSPANPIQVPPPVQAQAPQATQLDFGAIMQTMIQAQSSQNQSMMTILLSRIQSLEGAPAQAAAVNAPVQEPYDPLNQLKQTASTIAHLEKIKESLVSPDAPEGENSLLTTIASKFLDFEMQKRTDEAQQRQQRQQLFAQQQVQGQGNPQLQPPPWTPPPPMPPSQIPTEQGAQVAQVAQVGQQQPPQVGQQQTPAGNDLPGPLGNVPNDVFMTEVIKRLGNLSEEERMKYAGEILGQPIEAGYEDEEDEFGPEPDPSSFDRMFNPRQPDDSDVQDQGNTSIPGNEQLGTNEPSTVDPSKPENSA